MEAESLQLPHKITSQPPLGERNSSWSKLCQDSWGLGWAWEGAENQSHDSVTPFPYGPSQHLYSTLESRARRC